MRKVNKFEKDLHPTLYGYASPESIVGNWVCYVDSDGELRFVPCSYQFYKWWSNEIRKEQLRKIREKRCLIPSIRYKGYVRCNLDCSKCPYHKSYQDGREISLDELMEKYDYEVADASDIKHENENMQEIWEYISSFKEVDQQILKLFNKGLKDKDIAKILNLGYENLKKRRRRLIDLLKKRFLK